MRLEVGDLAGRYRVEHILGEGALAVVYKVVHADLDTSHALKVLKVPHDIFVDRLIAEGRAQAALKHKNVVSVTDIVEVHGSPGLLMELVDGTSLRSVLDEGRLTFEQAMQVGAGLLEGVAAAHRAGLIHRDLKPANIMMAIDGKHMIPKITDFGLVKALDDESGNRQLDTRTGVVLGTPFYMAPEQFDDAKNVDQRADVFSVGAILYELVTGRRPFLGEGLLAILNKASDGDYPPIQEFAPDAPEAIIDTIEAALEPDKRHRIANCALLLRMWTDMDGSGGDARFNTEILERIRVRNDEMASSLGERPETMETDETPTAVDPVPTPPEEEEESNAGLWMGLALALIVFLLLGGAVTTTVGAGLVALFVSDAATDVQPVEPSIPLQPVPQPEEPAPPTPEPAPEPSPTLEPQPPPLPTAPSPVPQPEPAPAPVPTGDATVSVSGDHTTFALKDGAGVSWKPGKVPPGTYTVVAGFADSAVAPRGRVTLRAGQVVNLRCDGVMSYDCRPE